MKLNNLSKTTVKKKKRVGRGYGSGKGGHTVGRGQKGQKSRSKVSLLFEGTKRRKSLMGRLPMMRGKGKLKPFSKKSLIVNLKFLNLLKSGATVDVNTLIKAGIVNKKDALEYGVKILGDGELSKKLIVKLPASKGAKKKIEKAGGRIVKVVKVGKGKRKAGKEKRGKTDRKKATLRSLKKDEDTENSQSSQKAQRFSVAKKASKKVKKPVAKKA